MKFFKKWVALSILMLFGSLFFSDIIADSSFTIISYAWKQLDAPGEIKTRSDENSIVISWGSVSGAEGYRVYMYSEDVDEFIKYKDVNGNKCTVKNLDSGKTYMFEVTALINVNGSYYDQTLSNVIYATTRNKTLDVPSNINVAVAGTTITISWNKLVGADAYRIYKYDTTEKKYKIFKTTKNTSIRMAGLDSEATYRFKVAALVKYDGTYVRQTLSKVIKVKTQAELSDLSFPGLLSNDWNPPPFGTALDDVINNSKISNTNFANYNVIGDIKCKARTTYLGKTSPMFLMFDRNSQFIGYIISCPISYDEYLTYLERVKEVFKDCEYMKDYGKNYWLLPDSFVEIYYNSSDRVYHLMVVSLDYLL